MSGPLRIAVIGAGVGGLAAALALARDGHEVVVLERDDTPTPATPHDAFDWDRRGAPQVRHSHAFLARLHQLLRTAYPDVLEALLAAGATEMRFGDDLPPTITGFEREPGDDELVMLACRRTTFEWVLRRAATGQGRLDLRTGMAVEGLVAVDGDGGRPRVTGVRLTGAAPVEADLVVIAAGRRAATTEWLTAIGAPSVPEEVDETGIVYLSRFSRLLPGHRRPPRSGPIGGDLGYLQYGVFAGDNDTFSITLAVPVDDAELRRVLADPVAFERAAQHLLAAAPWLDGRSEPITPEVHVMAGLLNRWRDYVVDASPVAEGVMAVGDAVLCTNPLYGRGCTTAFWAAHLLVDSLRRHPGDLRAAAVDHHVAMREQIHPWYRSSVDQDVEARRVAAALLAGEDPDADTSDPRTFMRAILRDGLLPALRTDAVVLRAFFRNFNLLSAPDALLVDPEVTSRVLAVLQARDQRPPQPLHGPATRDELLRVSAARG